MFFVLLDIISLRMANEFFQGSKKNNKNLVSDSSDEINTPPTKSHIAVESPRICVCGYGDDTLKKIIQTTIQNTITEPLDKITILIKQNQKELLDMSETIEKLIQKTEAPTVKETSLLLLKPILWNSAFVYSKRKSSLITCYLVRNGDLYPVSMRLSSTILDVNEIYNNKPRSITEIDEASKILNQNLKTLSKKMRSQPLIIRSSRLRDQMLKDQNQRSNTI
jgi:hypothetical protein